MTRRSWQRRWPTFRPWFGQSGILRRPPFRRLGFFLLGRRQGRTLPFVALLCYARLIGISDAVVENFSGEVFPS